MGIRTDGLINENDCAAAAEVKVGLCQASLIVRSKPVSNRQSTAQLQEGVSVISSAKGIGIKISVARQKIDGALRISRWPPAGHPDPSLPAVGRVVKDAELGERRSRISDDPTVIKVGVIERRP